jgi:hypothetical protein
MRKISFLSICLLAVCITVFTSFKTPSQTDDKSRIDDYEVDTKDLVYDERSGDFDEGAIPGVDTRTGLPISIIICPGVGERCTLWVWNGDHPTIYLAKKTVGGPVFIIPWN